ncbi:general transcription factor II-I repeat domain-containing protein 2A-like [Procambarus clarkii]|uniref:general transcription factor II-I repeat domain-containing protein 2A-like n=1 Tax=Procambarus clarkii TaxID=6728 RepID=UPI00374499B3
MVQIVCPEKVHLFKDISLTRNTDAERIDVMSDDLKEQLKAASSRFEHFSIAIDETVDITGTAQLVVFFRVCDSEFNIYEELFELIPMQDITRSRDILGKVEQVLHDYGLVKSKLACLSTYGAANIVGRHNGVAAKL